MTDDEKIPPEMYPAIAMGVYQACSNYDQYLPEATEPVMRAWAKVFHRYQLTAEDLMAAVDKLYAENGSGWKPLPGDIAQAARVLRTQRADSQVAVTPALTSAEEERASAARLEAMKALAAEKALDAEEPSGVAAAGPKAAAGPSPLSVQCPYCRAAVGSPCVVAGTSQRLTKTDYHDSRKELARQGVVA